MAAGFLISTRSGDQINIPVLVFSVVVAIVTGVMSGLAPAFQFSRPQVAQLMQSSSRRTTGGGRGKRTQSILVAGQIALTLLLLTSAAAAINGFVRLVHTELGYDPHNVMSVGIPGAPERACQLGGPLRTISGNCWRGSRRCQKW